MRTTRYLGSCQICEGDQKLHNERVVHHGYKRPGDGAIHGDCPGVGEVPYEVSCDLVKTYKVAVENRLVDLEKRLVDIQEGRVTKVVKASPVHRTKLVEYVLGIDEPRVFAQALQSLRWSVEGDIRGSKSEIARCVRRIAAWAPKPIRSVEEEQRKADADRAQRKAERDAARTQRDAKKAATRSKQDTLKANRLAIRKDFEAKFRALAESPESLPERQAAARKLLAELNKSKYKNWLGRWDLECEDAFIALGLAKAEGSRGDGRPFLRWGYHHAPGLRRRTRRRIRVRKKLHTRYGQAGWFGEGTRHSLAARKGWLRRVR